jgi:hypothetical protein
MMYVTSQYEHVTEEICSPYDDQEAKRVMRKGYGPNSPFKGTPPNDVTSSN